MCKVVFDKNMSTRDQERRCYVVETDQSFIAHVVAGRMVHMKIYKNETYQDLQEAAAWAVHKLEDAIKDWSVSTT